MPKFIDEFFDEIERFLIPFVLFVLISFITAIVWNFSFDFSGLNRDNFKEKITEIISQNRVKIIILWFSNLFVNLYVLMGLWACIMKSGRSSFSDFLKGGAFFFLKGLLPYAAINIYPAFIVILFLLSSKFSSFFSAFLLLVVIIFSIWIWSRISLWQPLIVKGKTGFSAVSESFFLTRGYAYLIFWIMIFPYAFFYNIGGSVTWSFLVYFFMFFNSAVLPASLEVIRYMLFLRVTRSHKTDSY
ncbi:MAG: hypothetical protein GX447_04175 [Elusimicrobia bacterium]|nr:hypothetical protein [Elusimicrobiota bacterium]